MPHAQTAFCRAVAGADRASGSVAIVGNGPLSPADRVAIQGKVLGMLRKYA